VREVEIEGRKIEIQDLQEFYPEFYADGVREASDAGLGLGIVGCLLQVLGFLAAYSLLLERNDICGGCEGQVPQAGYVSAFLAWLGEMIAVIVYKESFPFRDIYIAEDTR
jgi:hypothetical protein